MRWFLRAVFPSRMGAREVRSLLEESREELDWGALASGGAEGRPVAPEAYATAYGHLRSRSVESRSASFRPESRSQALFACAAADLAGLAAESAATGLKRLEEIRAGGGSDPEPMVIDLVRTEATNDARRALERVERHSLVLLVVPAAIAAFVLLSLPTVLASSLASALASDHSAGIRLLGVGSDLAGFLTRALMPAFFGLLGALLGIAFTGQTGGAGAHWRLERRHERAARLCLGALIGCLISVTGPVFLGSGDDYARLLVFSMVFGASQDTFYSRVIARAKG